MNRGCSFSLRMGLLIGLLALAGCYEPEPTPRIIGEDRPVALPAPQPAPGQVRLFGRSVQGRPIMAQIAGNGGDTTFIMATIHGNEPAGEQLVNQLQAHLRDNPQLLEGRRVVLLAVANPDGAAAGTRENVRGVDLNRNFEAENRVNNEINGIRALSEPESRAIKRALEEYAPNRIVSIHQPLNCIDYDGPGQDLATRMGQYCRLSVKKLGARPGSLGSYTGEEFKIPTVTLELPRSASKLDSGALWDQYGQAMLAAVMYPQHVSK